jgi:hypothetical protein
MLDASVYGVILPICGFLITMMGLGDTIRSLLLPQRAKQNPITSVIDIIEKLRTDWPNNKNSIQVSYESAQYKDFTNGNSYSKQWFTNIFSGTPQLSNDSWIRAEEAMRQHMISTSKKHYLICTIVDGDAPFLTFCIKLGANNTIKYLFEANG